MYPKIYLAMDNCVLYKRWTTPDEWAQVMNDLGIRYIEASADTEMDPLYMGKDYLADWVDDVKAAEARHGVKVCNLYSGHGSYTTLGLAHPDPRVRANMSDNFFGPMIHAAASLNCGVGFFAHAFKNSVLQSPESYARYVDIVTDELCRLNDYAYSLNCGKIGLEKMYTPHQYPWRNTDTFELLRAVKQKTGHDFYFTEDVGHHHTRFRRPEPDEIGKKGVWLGSDHAFDLAESGAPAEEIMADIEKNPQLFAEKSDADCYETLRLLGCYSPIIHLQQTPGALSSHLPFTPEENERGLVNGEAILRAIKESYDRPVDPTMPERCDELYLTLEIFSGTTSVMRSVLADCRTSVDYWRRFIPEDGLPLDQLI